MNDKDLIKHPEGGWFKEVYRSCLTVTEHSRQRCALTHIYFSLDQEDVSRFHKVTSDEIWNLYEGEGLTLYLWDEQSRTLEEKILSRAQREYCQVVPAGLWQAAVPFGKTVLVGCSVAPGFEFSDFELIDPDSAVAGDIIASHPRLARLIN